MDITTLANKQNNHYLPKFYSSYWKKDNSTNTVFKYSAPHKEIVCGKVSPRSVGAEEDLYAREDVPITKKHSLENDVYKKIDNDAATVIQKILKGQIDKLTSNERKNFSIFLHSLPIRHADQVGRTKELTKGVTEEIFQKMTAAEKEKYGPEHQAFSSNAHITVMEALSNSGNQFGLAGQKKFVNAMNTLTWWVEDFSDTDPTLLTSDSPIRLIPTGNENLSNFNSSGINSIADLLNTKKYYLFMPLSPKIAFFAAPQKTIWEKSKEKLINNLNLVTIKSAKKFVIAQDERHDSIIKEQLRHLIQ